MRSISRLSPAQRGSAPATPAAAAEGQRREAEDAPRLAAEAEALGIPWRDVLSREIQAEGTLQRFLGSEIEDLPLWRAVSILPHTLFHSWRVRRMVDRLCFDAASEGSREARRELARLVEGLSGAGARDASRRATLAKHYWFAYHRVLELQAVALAAEKSASHGTPTLADLVESTGASGRDAAWAVARLTSPTRSHALDDAMGEVRREGFDMPRADTELKAFLLLRRVVLRSRTFRSRRSRRRGIPRVAVQDEAASPE